VDLIVFDLDGTLLDSSASISAYTRETLELLGQRGIAYTVATGRTLHATRDLISGHGFELPQIYKNGVVIWNPQSMGYTHRHLVTQDEVEHVLGAFIAEQVTPFIFTLEPGERHAVYHPALQNDVERNLVRIFKQERGLPVLPVSELPGEAEITNVSAIGKREAIEKVVTLVESEPDLVAYMGLAMEDKNLCWVDIHHSDGSKGDAVSTLKSELNVSRVICFGDSDNDLSMFACADEAYAPENAKEQVKAAATATIGHHDEEGIARFLRQRFDLPTRNSE
jgi:Cof subfamily protein (haloacid dehalogenase superfamily)